MDPKMPNSIVLFGVRVVVADSIRKCVSLNNLSDYELLPLQAHPTNKGAAASSPAAGYGSADDVVPPQGTRERKRGVPWTEDEHKLFLMGLQKVGKGDWRGISKNFVKTRTPTQVASHAQKYFLRRSNLNRRRRRSSLFDITTDSVAAMEEAQSPNHYKSAASLAGMVPPEAPLTKSFPIPNPKLAESVDLAPATVIRPIPIVPAPGVSASPPFDLNLSLTSPSQSLESTSRPSSVFRPRLPSFSNGDISSSSNSSIISVA